MAAFITRRSTRSIVLALIGLAAAGLLVVLLSRPAGAQWDPNSGWSKPFNVSDSLTPSIDAAIVADDFGFVHIFWSENLDAGPVSASDGAVLGLGNTIMYRRLGPDGWTEPVDIFYGGEDGRRSQPAAVVDRSGNLNLVWIQYDGLYYSYAPIATAAQANAWAKPVKVDEGTIGDARIILLPRAEQNGQAGDDQLLVVYGQTVGENLGLFAAVITDRWPQDFLTVWRGSGNLAPWNIAATTDRKGRIHVAWEVMRVPQPSPIQVWYGVSDGSHPLQFDDRLVTEETSQDDSLQFARPWLAVRGDDEVHLQWAQGRLTYRWHEYSTDGGKTWTEPYQIWPDLISQTGSQAAGADSSDTLYWVDVFRYPSGAYLTKWTGQIWERPQLFYLKYLTPTDRENDNMNVHYIRMAISLGNQLHIVFLDLERGEIWHMQKSLPAPAIAPQPLVVPIPTETQSAEASPVAPSSQSSPAPVSLISAPAIPATQNKFSDPGVRLLFPMGAVLLILAVVVMIKIKMR